MIATWIQRHCVVDHYVDLGSAKVREPFIPKCEVRKIVV